MAGSNPGFNAADFRKNIRFVYDMAAPNLEGEQATFFMPSQLVYNVPTDEDDVPFSPTALPVTPVPPQPIQVSCGVEYYDSQGNIIDFGISVPSRAAITLLDEDYEIVKGCAFVVLRGERFNYRSTRFPQGLFDVDLYTMNFEAENAGGV